VALELELPLPPGAEWLPAKQSPFGLADGIDASAGQWLRTSVAVSKPETFVAHYRAGVTLVPLQDALQPGDTSRRLRIIDVRFAGTVLTARVQGLAGRRYTIGLRTPLELAGVEARPAAAGAAAAAVRELPGDARQRTVEVTFPAGAGQWTEATIVARFKRR
jgi:hypothetical protein